MMRGLLVVGLPVLAFGAGIVQAEARFRGRGGGHSVPLRCSLASTPGLAVVPALTLRSDEARAARPDAGEPSAAKPGAAKSSASMKASMTRTGLSASIQSSTQPAAGSAGCGPRRL